MDLELVAEGVVAEGNTFGVDDFDNDYPTLEGERCGICMDIVVDRGVLDCCQHWFCFACIDNWASITNLCPLCQNEFQLITCVPVYDTVGSSLDEDSYSRDDDWCVEGKNNTLSFPSYYIDENAVVCLEGDDCKIRSGSANIAEDSNLDTSIACDSCDLWYHAFCVGFDPDGTCENSWLCPRCLVASTPKRSNEHDLGKASNECSVDASFSTKVSVSIADTGETAVVVSMIEGNPTTEVPSENLMSRLDVSNDLKNGRNQGNEEPNRKFLPNLDVFKEPEINALEFISGANNCDLETAASEKISRKPNLEAGELDLSLSREKASRLPSHSSVLPELRNVGDNSDICDRLTTCSEKLFVEHFMNEPLESGFNLQLGLSMASSLPVENINHLAEDHAVGKMQQKNSSKDCRLPAEKTQQHKECAVGLIGAKRKQREYRSTENGERKAKMQQHNVSAKKIKKAERSSGVIHVKEQINDSTSDDSQISTSLVAGPEDGNFRCTSRKDHATADIRDIVHETSRRTLRRKSSKEGENAAGLRVKKIMRRSTEDNESAMVVQKLRKEIRDIIRNKSSNDLGNNLFDSKLLAAFRAVVAGTTENRKPLPLDLKAKKLLLQKGKIRENLTKKIYGIGGRRKRAWTRDCEIEFWKHRCLKVSKPEKIETLKSVLNLLRKSPEITEIKQENDTGATSSILSRLYLADASVFPRKDDIKPLSALKATGILEQSKGPTSTEKASTPFPADSSVLEDSKGDKCTYQKSKGDKCTLPSLKGESASSKAHTNEDPERSFKSSSSGSPLNSQKETVGKVDLRKIDKRKWALEVLARKTTVSGKNAGQGQGDNAVLKGNFPLLAQLPADMRPVLAPSRHNKIPLSVRQTQLQRLTEHFLRKTNIPVTRRSAEIELAVVDAVNVEKEVADRSSSKLVYVNLCSQALLHKSDNVISANAPDSNPSPTSDLANDRSEVANNIFSSSEVDEALRNAGLLSDSPPSSPYNQEYAKEKLDPSENINKEGPDNVFEIDAQPELDIYGDFEYDLEEEDFIGASALKISKVEHEKSKIKVVFSTLDSNKPNGSWNFEDDVAPKTAGPTNADNLTDKCLPQKSLDEGSEEPLFEECEELYGPDKEPLISKFPESASLKSFELPPNNLVPEEKDQKSNISEKASEGQSNRCSDNLVIAACLRNASGGEDSFNQAQKSERKEKSRDDLKNQPVKGSSVFKKVESYIKEHIRPLCKSGVITIEQYRWAVGKTTEKIMKYHSKDTNANFLIKEGEKVKKLAEQYVETAQKVEKAKIGGI